jgi:uncharacterized OB-fold protein
VSEPTPETAFFWSELAEGRLVARRCLACGAVQPYPRRFCPDCGGEDAEWVARPQSAILYSFTVIPDPPPDRPDLPRPLVLGIVEFDDAQRMLTLLLTYNPESIAIGDRVIFTRFKTGDAALPAFGPPAAERSEKPE